VAATATLRRRLAGESRRSALEDLLSRRRSSRARSNRLATPPGGLMLTPPVPPVEAETPDVVTVVDLPAVERPADTHVVDLAAELVVAEPCPAEGTVASIVTQRGPRRGRSRAASSSGASSRASSSASAGASAGASPGASSAVRASEGDVPGPAA
jgi:hypothetical protein